MRFADKTQTFDKTWAPSTILWLLSSESFEPAKKFTLSTCAKKKKKSGAERAPTTELRLGEDWRKKGSPLCGNAGLKSCDLRFLFVNDFDVVFSRVGVNYWITYD